MCWKFIENLFKRSNTSANQVNPASMTSEPGHFSGAVLVLPATNLHLVARPVGDFELTSVNPGQLRADSNHPEATKLFRSDGFFKALERLAWDLVWENQVAVQFEPSEGKRTVIDEFGRQKITFEFQETMYSNLGNPRAGLKVYANFDLLQQIRDYLIGAHLAGGDSAKFAKLQGNAAILLAMEHFIKGVVNRAYALAEFYSVVESVENQIGGRHKIVQLMTKQKIDKITRFANDAQLDQRHPPHDPATMAALPPNAVEEAGIVAKEIINEFVKGIV